jgi:hypothetical protein
MVVETNNVRVHMSTVFVVMSSHKSAVVFY